MSWKAFQAVVPPRFSHEMNCGEKARVIVEDVITHAETRR